MEERSEDKQEFGRRSEKVITQNLKTKFRITVGEKNPLKLPQERHAFHNKNQYLSFVLAVAF